MKDNYTFPVVIERIENYTLMTFPSFCNMVTETDGDFIKAAQEVITLQVMDAEAEGREFLEDIPNISLKKGQKLVYVNVWMPYHRTTAKTAYIRKNVTIPAWLGELAKNAGINFSETLAEALRAKLSIYGN